MAAGCSADGLDTVAPLDVTGFSAVYEAGSIVLTWADNTVDRDVFGYELSWRQEDPLKRAALASPGAIEPDTLVVPPGDQRFTLGSVEPGAEYVFTIRTIDLAGNRSGGVTASSVAYRDEAPDVFLTSFRFSKNHNPVLPDSFHTERRLSVENTLEYATFSLIEGIDALVPIFEANGKVLADGVELTSGVSPVDFSETAELLVQKPNGREKTYYISISSPRTSGSQLIRPVATSAQSHYFDRGHGHAIDGSGMIPKSPLTASTCSLEPGSTTWLSDGNTDTWIAFDLGSVQTISGFHLWNYNEVGYTGRGVMAAELYAGSFLPFDGAPHATEAGREWGTLVEAMTFAEAPGTYAYAGEDYRFRTPVTTRYLQLHVTANFGTSDTYTGISEILFFGGR